MLAAFQPTRGRAGSLAVELHGGKATAELFDPEKKYVFGLHHHGLYPLG